MQDLGIDVSIVLKWILRQEHGSVWTRFACSREGIVAVSSEHDNELVMFQKMFEMCPLAEQLSASHGVR
jgi:hypothetical protein